RRRTRSGSPSAQNASSASSKASPERTAACDSSSSGNRGPTPAWKGWFFNSRLQKPWIVEIQAESSSRARSRRPRLRSSARIRVRSSPAARFVYVMTRIESTSTPWSQTARTKRSTSTAVLPVPAPAETKTRPFASIASRCSGFGSQVTRESPDSTRVDRSFQTGARAKPARPDGDIASDVSCSLHAADRPEVAPGRALAALRVVPDVSGADVPGELSRGLASSVHLGPELVLVQVVVARAADDVLLRVRAKETPRPAPAGEGPGEAPQRLDPDEIPEHEHVERDLEAELLLHLARRRRMLARLVVLDDPTRAQRLDVDPVDLPREDEVLAELEAALKLRSGTLAAKGDLEVTRLERGVGRGLDTNESFEVARQRLFQLAALQLRHLQPNAAEGPLEALTHEVDRILHLLGPDAVAPENLGEAGEELEERAVGDRAAELRVDFRIDRPRVQHPIDEPGRGAVGEALA